jgi:hypothetical protein
MIGGVRGSMGVQTSWVRRAGGNYIVCLQGLFVSDVGVFTPPPNGGLGESLMGYLKGHSNEKKAYVFLVGFRRK